MDDSLQNKSDFSLALELGKLLDDHRGIDVVVMDMRSLNFWTDFFVIATVMSNTHLSGLERHIKEFVRENGLDILRRSSKSEKGDEWHLMDLGEIVIHLMTAATRSFFELERLWSAAPLIYQGNKGSGEADLSQAHSSKSS